MGYMDLQCSTTINLANKVNHCPCQSNQLYLGCNYEIYLFFALPPTVFFSPIKEAKLILFKIPAHFGRSPVALKSNIYSIYPLLDFCSVYSSSYTPPRIDTELAVDYEDIADMSYTEIDITSIIAAWSKEKPENRGLLLTGAPKEPYLIYASEQHEFFGMRPMLRLKYEDFSHPLSTAACDVKILEN